LSIKIKKRNI